MVMRHQQQGNRHTMPIQYELYATNGDRLNTYEDEGAAIIAARRHDGSRVDRVTLTVESIEQVWPKLSTMAPDDVDVDDGGFEHVVVIPTELWDAIAASRPYRGTALIVAAMTAPDPERRGYELVIVTDNPLHPSEAGVAANTNLLEIMRTQIAADLAS